MRFEYFIEIKGIINSRELYNKIQIYGANVTDLVFMTFVYGEANLDDFIEIAAACFEFSDIDIHFQRCE